jgi:TolA-binding protein
VYSDRAVADFVQHHFLPVRLHVKDDSTEFQRVGAMFNAQWTPTVLIVDPPAAERHRIEGFLPAPDFASQLALGVAKSAFARGDFQEAAAAFDELLQKFPDSEAAPEAQYWAGVSRYKASGDAGALGETARQFKDRYADTSWAKKASVWG